MGPAKGLAPAHFFPLEGTDINLGVTDSVAAKKSDLKTFL